MEWFNICLSFYYIRFLRNALTDVGTSPRKHGDLRQIARRQVGSRADCTWCSGVAAASSPQKVHKGHLISLAKLCNESEPQVRMRNYVTRVSLKFTFKVASANDKLY